MFKKKKRKTQFFLMIWYKPKCIVIKDHIAECTAVIEGIHFFSVKTQRYHMLLFHLTLSSFCLLLVLMGLASQLSQSKFVRA